MVEFLQFCFTAVNFPFTLFLILVFCYWIFFIIGAVGLDTLDFDLDLDTDVDVAADVDANVEAEVTGSSASGMFVSLLRFFNVADVPLMIWISFFSFFLWASSILTSYYLNPQLALLLAVGLFIPNLIGSLVLTKLATVPFRLVFKHANTGIQAPTKIVGKTCIVTTSEVTPTFGQAELPQEGAPITLNVRSREGEALSRGMEALVIDHNEEKNTYTVVPFDLEIR